MKILVPQFLLEIERSDDLQCLHVRIDSKYCIYLLTARNSHICIVVCVSQFSLFNGLLTKKWPFLRKYGNAILPR